MQLALSAIEAAFHAGYPPDAGAVLLVEVDGLLEQVEAQAAVVDDVCRAAGAMEIRLAASEEDRARLWAARKGAAKILYQLDKLARKTAREAMRRQEWAGDDTTFLENLVYPHRHLQERFYSMVPFLAKYGPGLPNQLSNEVQLGCPDHMIRVI